jgi:NAD(P) transhydrogenase subunit alpha
VSTVLGFAAVTAATINVVGGFVITDRMLKMFKRDPTPAKDGKALPASGTPASGAPPASGTP